MRFLIHGTITGQYHTETFMIYHTALGQPLMSRAWCLAIWAMIPARVLLSQGIPQPVKTSSMANIFKMLENHYKDMQDIEFTFQEGILYMLQTRTGKRTAASAIQVAVDMFKEGLIDKKTAVLRVEPD